MGMFFGVVSAQFLKDVINEELFDRGMQSVEIHRACCQVFCMGFTNFEEVYKMK
jgi:hypothetical protein